MPPDAPSLLPPFFQPLAWLGGLGAVGVIWLLGLGILFLLGGRRTWVGRLGVLDTLTLALACGFPAAAALLLAVGQRQGLLFHVPWLPIGALGWLAAGAWGISRRRAKIFRGLAPIPVQRTARERLIKRSGRIVLVVTLGLLLFPAFYPPVNYDVLEYHLGWVVHIFAIQRVRPIPHVFYTAQPLATEMLYTLAAAIERTPRGHAPGVMQWLLLVAAALLLVRLARRLALPAPWRPYLALLALTHATMWTQWLDRFTDWPGMLLLAAGIFAWRLGHGGSGGDDDAPLSRRRVAVLLGLFAGGAVSVKWTNIGAVALPLMLLAFELGWLPGETSGEQIKSLGWTCGLCSAAAFLTWLPWGAWLWLVRGNPFAPFMADWFPTAEWPAARLRFLIETHGPLFFWQWHYWTNLIVRLFWGLGGLPILAWALVGAAGAALLARPSEHGAHHPHRSEHALGWLIAGVIGALLLWGGLRDAAARFLIPALVPGTLALGLELRRLSAWRPGVGHLGQRLAVGILVVTGLGSVLDAAYAIQAGGYGTEAVRYATHPEDVARAWGPQLEMTGDLFAQVAKLPAEAHIITVSEARRYPFGAHVDLASVFDESPLRPFIRGAVIGDTIRTRLAAAGYTHLLVNDFETLRILAMHTPPLLVENAEFHQALEAGNDPLLMQRYWGYTEFAADPLQPMERRVYGEFLTEMRRRATWSSSRNAAGIPAMWIAPLN